MLARLLYSVQVNDKGEPARDEGWRHFLWSGGSREQQPFEITEEREPPVNSR